MARLANPKRKVTTYRLYPRAGSMKFKCHVGGIYGPGLTAARADAITNDLHWNSLNRHLKWLNALAAETIDVSTLGLSVYFEQYSPDLKPCGVGSPRVSRVRRDVDLILIADPNLQYVPDEYDFRCGFWSLVHAGIVVGLKALVKRLDVAPTDADRYLEAVTEMGHRYVGNAYSPMRVRRPEDPCVRSRGMLYYTTEFEASELADRFLLDLKERGFEVHARVMASGRYEVIFWRDVLRGCLLEEESADLHRYVASFGGVVVRTLFC